MLLVLFFRDINISYWMALVIIRADQILRVSNVFKMLHARIIDKTIQWDIYLQRIFNSNRQFASTILGCICHVIWLILPVRLNRYRSVQYAF